MGAYSRCDSFHYVMFPAFNVVEVIWFNGKTLVLTIVVSLHWALLVLAWAIICGWVNNLSI